MPGVIGQFVFLGHSSSMVGLKGIKLYVAEYLTVPDSIKVPGGTVKSSDTVEFSLRTAGSGQNATAFSLNRDVPLEQSIIVACVVEISSNMAVFSIILCLLFIK